MRSTGPASGRSAHEDWVIGKQRAMTVEDDFLSSLNTVDYHLISQNSANAYIAPFRDAIIVDVHALTAPSIMSQSCGIEIPSPKSTSTATLAIIPGNSMPSKFGYGHIGEKGTGSWIRCCADLSQRSRHRFRTCRRGYCHIHTGFQRDHIAVRYADPNQSRSVDTR